MAQFAFPFQPTLLSQLPAPVQELVAAATAATDKAYAPYSKFRVGAAVLLNDGSVITGANHENASFPAGICAERAALSTLEMTDRSRHVQAIAITYQGTGASDQPISPCGICRQSILEVQHWQASPITIYMCSPEGPVIYVEDAAFLLPFSFTGAQLGSSR